MIIRKLDFLKLDESLPMVKFEVYQGNEIGIVNAKNRGYVLFNSLNDEWDNIFFIKTRTIPEQYLVDELNIELSKNKDEFIGIIEMILDSIYDENIKTYEKKHPEFVFLRLFDNLTKTEESEIEFITKDNQLYDLIDEGFIRLDLSYLGKDFNG